jgi:hypothetical protein
MFRRAVFHRVTRILPVLAIFVLCTSCSGFFVANSSISTVMVSPSALILKAGTAGTPPVAGDSSQLTATATTVGGTTSDETSAATWTSSNSSAATVNAGLVTAVGLTAGLTSVITATAGGQSSTCNILTYAGAAPSTVNVNFPTTISPSVIAPGTIFQVTATATLSGINTDISKYVTWSSNATSIATVDVNGNVTAIGTPGTFTITAIATFGSTSVQGVSTNFTVI